MIAYDIVNLEYLGDQRLRLTFADGIVAEIDFGPKLESLSGPVFEPLRDPDYFAKVSIDRELRTIVWPNGADFAPDVLHALAVAAA